jgi:hypothetical protein
MAEPARKFEPDIEPDITPRFGVIDGGGESDSRRASLKALEKQESNPSKPNTGSVAEREATGSNVVQGPWKNKVVQTAGAMKPESNSIMVSIKKQSPMLAIILTVVGLMGAVSIFSASSMLPISILANVVQKFNTQETSATIRTNKLLISKMVGNTTEGTCTSFINIACRFSRPSNRFLSQLEDQGITAMDSKGNIISEGGLFPNTRPKSYRYFNSDGDSVVVEAKDLKSALTNDPDFAARFSNATKTRFMSLTDSVFDSIKARFGFNTDDELKTATDEKSVTSDADAISAADDNGVKAAASAGGDSADQAAVDIVKGEAKDEVEQLQDNGSSGGGLVGLVAGGICIGTDVPGLIIKADRAYQMAQLIRYSVVFLSAFGAIKAGDASPAEVGAIGASLTQIVKGKSAMDSFGMRYVMDGDTKPQNNNYQRFSPGSSVIASLGGVNTITNSRAKTAACNVMTNPVTGEAIDTGLAANAGDTAGISAIAAALNVAGGYIFGYVIGTALPPIVDLAVKHLPVESILKDFFGDLTKGLAGEDVGDALTSGAANVMGQTANAGGNMPLTPSQAVAYENTTDQVQVAYAKEDRATLSPLDASNPNTFLGSIVQRLIPFYIGSDSSLGSASNTFGTIGKIIMGSFSLALQPLSVSAESNDEAQYQLCNEPDIKNNNIAAGPFCNIIYGIPTQYLDKDPLDVVNDLVKGGSGIYAGNIAADTGDPIPGSDLAKWLALCTDGTTDEAANCKITNEKTADFALYTVDHRIQESMDTDETPSSTDTTTTPTTSNAQQLAQQIMANSKISLTGRLVEADIQDAANGNVGTAGVMTSTAILQLINTIGQSHSVAISAIQSGGSGHCNNTPKSSCPNDPHYTGDAVDFDILDGIDITGRNSPALTIMKIAEGILPTGSAFGQKQCGPTPTLPSGWTTFDDTCNHLHVQVPAGTP